jgi:hypothetical protein
MLFKLKFNRKREIAVFIIFHYEYDYCVSSLVEDNIDIARLYA